MTLLNKSRIRDFPLSHFTDAMENRDTDIQALEEIVGKIKEITPESDGKYDDGGMNVERVYHFVDHDVYMQLTGYWTSYEGARILASHALVDSVLTLDQGFEEVFPQQKTITVFGK